MSKTNYNEAYMPVEFDFEEDLKSLILSEKSGKVHFFNSKGHVDDAVGSLTCLEKNGIEKWLVVSQQKVRIDKIITVLGKPGPAYDYYNSFANACMTCEDLGQF